jgi:Uri superfamily endonuclease
VHPTVCVDVRTTPAKIRAPRGRPRPDTDGSSGTAVGDQTSLPAGPGCYALLLRVAAPRSVAIGALGVHRLRSGWYVYCGSAQGPGGLRARVRRHLRDSPICHWHVDYLRRAARVAAVLLWPGAPRAFECRAAAAFVALHGSRIPVPGFGSSDCGCPGHLVALTERAATSP